MNYLLVDRNAQRGGIALVPEESGNRSVRTDKIFGYLIQLLGGDAGRDVATHLRQRLAHQDVVFAKQLDFLVCL